jgi:hypothetical protein
VFHDSRSELHDLGSYKFIVQMCAKIALLVNSRQV